MSLIDLSNYKTTLAQSTAGRAGNINGNIFFDKVGGTFEALPVSEAPFINLTNAGTPTGTADVLATANVDTTYYMIKTIGTTDFTLFGALSNTVGLVFQSTATPGLGTGTMDECTANPLISADGVKMEAEYAFENQERNVDEDLRKYDRWLAGSFKFAGAYNLVNGRVFASAADVSIQRGSGWNEINTSGNITKKQFGAKGLSRILGTSQPYFQLSVQGTAVDFNEVGQIDEAVLVERDDNGDGTLDESNTTYMAVSVRTYGQTHDRKETTTDLGITELGGYSTGFALDEQPHLTTSEASYPIADVYNTPAGVWLNMQLEHVPSPTAKVGEFEDETGTRLFSWELKNINNADLKQCVAWLDAFSASTDEADGLTVNLGHLGRDIETWYTVNASGQIVTKSGVTPASEGMYIQAVPTADQQGILQTDDGGTEKNYKFLVAIQATVGGVAVADALAWYHSYEAAAYNTSGAITLLDDASSPVKGNVLTDEDGSDRIVFSRAYTADLDCVFLCEGDGGATQAKTLYTITNTPIVAFACIPAAETNV